MTKNLLESQLSSYVQALHPIIYIYHFDFKIIENLIQRVGSNLGLDIGSDIKEFSFFNVEKNKTREKCLIEFLREAFLSLEDEERDSSIPLFILLNDVHTELNNPEVISLLKKLAIENIYGELYCTIFIVSSKLEIPQELEKLITIFEIPYPNQDEIITLIRNFQKSYNLHVLSENDNSISSIAQYLLGLSHLEILKTLNLCYQERGYIDQESKNLILEEKKQIIKKSGLLELVKVNSSFKDVGGLPVLTKWLTNKSKIFKSLREAQEFGVDIPKGIMVVGQPGCGKSLVAKATAELFNFPLLRLDIGRILGKYVGESENNFHRAIQIAESVSPCVLWIDEIEKAFTGVGKSGSGNDVSTRLFGIFLTWLQEKNSLVFVIATANEIEDKLPPEFIRKGRFDKLFYIGLPEIDDQEKIFKIHLENRGKKWTKDIKNFFSSNEKNGYKEWVKGQYYSGADIEDIVKQTIETVFVDKGKIIESSDLRLAIKNSTFINEEEKKEIDENREKLKKFGVINASY